MDRSRVNRSDSRQTSSDHKSRHDSTRHGRHYKEDERKRKRTHSKHDRHAHRDDWLQANHDNEKRVETRDYLNNPHSDLENPNESRLQFPEKTDDEV
jgi:hypothetical protein